MTRGNKKIIFFGTPDFTVRFLESLKNNGIDIVMVVTNPDRKSGRGMEISQPAPKSWALENNIEVRQPEKIDETFIEELAKINPDLFLVIAYGKILPEKFINIPKYGTINVHYSLLPKHRGATPVESAILNGDNITGISIQQMHFKLDSGPIIFQKEVAIDVGDTTPTLLEKLNSEALKVLPEIVDNIFDNKTNPKEQDVALATFCRKISKEEGEIFLDGDPIINDRKFRAYYGGVGTYFNTKYRGQNIMVKVKEAHFSDGNFIIDKVVPENKKVMSFEEFTKWVQN